MARVRNAYRHHEHRWDRLQAFEATVKCISTQFSRQPHTFAFSLVILRRYARLLTWDRSATSMNTPLYLILATIELVPHFQQPTSSDTVSHSALWPVTLILFYLLFSVFNCCSLRKSETGFSVGHLSLFIEKSLKFTPALDVSKSIC